MELIKKNIHMEHRINWATTQLSLEEDVNISDQKPDAFKVVCKNSYVKIEEVKPIEEAVWIKGALCYSLMYLTDEKEHSVCGMEGTIAFEEKVYTEKNVSGDSLRIYAKVEDMTVRLINSRKINIRSIVGMKLTQEELYDEEVVVDVEDPQACEILKKPMDVTAIVLDTKDIYRIKEEIMVPDGMPNIYSIIWKAVRLEGVNFTAMDGRVGITGEIYAFFMYEGEEEEARPRYFEVSRPFSGILDVPECNETMLLRMDYEVEPVHVETKTDYDGEERQIDLDAEIKLYIKLYQSATLSVVADAYGIQEKVTPVMKESRCERVLKKETGKIKISDMWENIQTPGMNMQLLHTDGGIVEEEVSLKEDAVELNGVVHIEMLCMSDDESDPYRCNTVDIPYSHVVPVNGADGACPYYAKVYIEQINTGVQGDRIEIRVILSYQLMVYQVVTEPLLSAMKKMENDEEGKNLPVMSVYFAKDHETIWEIGKKYQVPLGTIRDTNQLSSDELQNGQKILIVKERV